MSAQGGLKGTSEHQQYRGDGLAWCNQQFVDSGHQPISDLNEFTDGTKLGAISSVSSGKS